MVTFYNRQRELQALTQRWEAPDGQFALLYGRRRVGKTYLLQHFLEKKPHVYFLAAQTSLADNLSQLAQAALSAVPHSGYSVADISTLNSILRFISSASRESRLAVVLDEFQYLLQQDPSLPSQIQAWWDTEGIRSKVFLVLCGSHLGIMDGLGGAQQPLFGRFTFRYKLPPMSYDDIASFYTSSHYTTREKLIAYGVFGGTPRYHALVNPRVDLHKNVCDLILSPLGTLHSEPEVLMSSSQVRDPAPYNAVLLAIAAGCTKFNEIAQRVKSSSSQLSFYLKGLLELEWITRERPFGEASEKRSIYAIADHFLRFWYRFVAVSRSQLELQDVSGVYRTRVQPYLDDYMGRYVFENVCLQYLNKCVPACYNLQILDAGRYWSRDGSAEIDIVADLDDGATLACECKWSSSPIGVNVYYGLMKKLSRLPPPRGTGPVRYALFSAAGFDESMTHTAVKDGVILVSGEDLLDTHNATP
ncbi:MAG: ATP-binding protein [Armatimonadetes bacterium]|nr:ATP-binding protein [Armatimonadota bacterium]